MARKSALQKIESHEKLCRIMQKQTFEQIKEMQERIKRLEYWIVGGMGAVLITLLPPLPSTPQPVVNTQTSAQQIDPNTNLTRTQQALLSPTEQVIASRRQT